MEGGILLPLYRYRFIRLDFETINSVVVLDYTIIILGGLIHESIRSERTQENVPGILRGQGAFKNEQFVPGAAERQEPDIEV